VSDRELREVERELATTPSSLDLRRRHARLLARAGRGDAALDALDLAWRLGAADLWDELRAGLDERRVQVAGLELRYVPGGPFVMGRPDFDADAAPAHLVTLSPFYVSARTLSWWALLEWPEVARRRPWLLETAPEHRAKYSYPVARGVDEVRAALDFLNGARGADGLRALTLPSEAQWERAHRAALLTPDGSNPYGLSDHDAPEWTADRYDAAAYDRGPGRDPAPAAEGELHVVRGIPGLPARERLTYREVASADGQFPFHGMVFTRWARGEVGVRARVVCGLGS